MLFSLVENVDLVAADVSTLGSGTDTNSTNGTASERPRVEGRASSAKGREGTKEAGGEVEGRVSSVEMNGAPDVRFHFLRRKNDAPPYPFCAQNAS